MKSTKQKRSKIKVSLVSAVVAFTFLSLAPLPRASAATSQYIFPVLGSSDYTNDFNAGRFNGRHNAIDIIANKRQPIVSATDGVITYVAIPPHTTAGYFLNIRSDSGYTYSYLHMNNDNTGTDDGKGGPMQAFAPDIERGRRVVRGQLLGWVGDSGNAESTVSHLHFEVTNASDQPYNPYYKLNDAQRIQSPVAYPQASDEILPFGRTSKTNANLAYDDLDRDGVNDYIVGAGYGSPPWVKVFSGRTKAKLLDFYPMSGKGNRGADVATGDVDGDGVREIIVGAKTMYGGKVAAYKMTGGKAVEVGKQTVYGGTVSDVRVSAGDIDGDRKDEVYAGAGPGGGPRVKILDIVSGQEKRSFYPFRSDFRGGVDVSAGNMSGDAKDEIISVPFLNGSSLVRVHTADVQLLRTFTTYGRTETDYKNGVRISAGNIDRSGYDELVTMPNDYLGALKVFNNIGQQRTAVYPYEDWWVGRFDAAASSGDYAVIAGYNRRTSVR